MTKSNGSRIMWIERPLWQEREFQMQGQRLIKSRKICEMLNRGNRHSECWKKQFRKCSMLSKTVWMILQVQTMRMIEKTMQMMKMIQSFVRSVKMINLAGWWAECQKQYSTAWWIFSRSGWGLMNWRSQNGGTQPTTSMREIWIMGWPDW